MKRMMLVSAVAAIAVLAACGLVRKSRMFSMQRMISSSGEPMEDAGMEDGGKKKEVILVANAETQQEAEEIAALYGITLVEYELKVATYLTDKEPQGLIRRGEEMGYPPIAVNHKVSLH